MKITVAIITRNRAHQLKRCLKSLCEQTDSNFNVLVVDNDSTDNTKETVSSFESKLKIRYIFEAQIGRPFARNKALGEVKGDIMASMDDDCEASVDWIERIKESHKKFRDAIAIQGWATSKPADSLISIIVQFNKENTFRDNIIAKKNFFFIFNNDFLKKPSPSLLIDTKNASFKIKKLKRTGIKFDRSFKYIEDLEFSKKILAKKMQVIFDPRIRNYHWERAKLTELLIQRYHYGAETMRSQLKWPLDLFPKRKRIWWIAGRSLNFFVFILLHRYFLEFIMLILIFNLERSAYIIGKLVEYIKFKFKFS